MAKSKKKGGVKRALKRRAAYRKGGRGGPGPTTVKNREPMRTVGRKDPAVSTPPPDFVINTPRPPADITDRGTVGGRGVAGAAGTVGDNSTDFTGNVAGTGTNQDIQTRTSDSAVEFQEIQTPTDEEGVEKEGFFRPTQAEPPKIEVAKTGETEFDP